MSTKTLFLIFRDYIQFAIVITFVAGLVYLTVQQNIRMSANDPQIQLAEDVSQAMANGANPQTMFPQNVTDIEKSLSPYVIVYDESGRPIAASGVLDGQPPAPPRGVFDHARANEVRVTWQPKAAVRSAIVVAYFKGVQNSGFVLAGRSLREVEKRENTLLYIVIVSWAAALLAVLFGALLAHYLFFIDAK